VEKKMTMLRSSLLGGLCLAGFHAFWVLLIFVGWAQTFIDFVLELHMMAFPLTLEPFQLFVALKSVAFAFLVGCFYGLIIYMVGKLVFRGF
jgi:hypothetical protein